jgi:glycosyltransferase involved in cell wall biosynthesis
MVTSQRRPTLSVVIAAKNEAANIADCVASAAFADEVIVFDSNSSDATVEMAHKAGARTVSTDWPGYGPQQARAFRLATCDWVLSLDADERITPELKDEVQSAIATASSKGLDGFWLPRNSQFCGHFIHHSGWRPDHTLRLGLREKSSFTNHYLHAHMTVDGATAKLTNPMLHYSYPTVSTLMEKLDRYSSGSAKDMHSVGKRGGLGKAISHGFWAFVKTYVVKRGFLDGKHGVMLAIYNAEYAYYKYVKLMLLNEPNAPTGPKASGPHAS